MEHTNTMPSPYKVIDQYLDTFSSPNTRRAYRNDLYAFFAQDGEIKPGTIEETTSHDVNAHISQMERDGKNPTTILRRRSTISGFYKWAVAVDYIARNPVGRYTVRNVKPSEYRPPKALTKAEARQLIEAASKGYCGLRNKTIVLMGLYCALRRSEIVAVDIEHFEEREGSWVLHIPTSKGGRNQIVKVKPVVMDHVFRLAKAYDIDSGPLFRVEQGCHAGERLADHRVLSVVRTAAKWAGLKNVCAHSLRHTSITVALRGGAHIDDVQKFARHKSVNTTMRYIHNQDWLHNNAVDTIQY